MRTVKIAVVAVMMFLLVSVSVSAETVEELYNEQLEASGAKELIETLPEETQLLLRTLGIDTLSHTAIAEMKSETVWGALLELFSAALKVPLAAGGTVLVTVLLHAWSEGLRHTLREEETASVFGAVCALSVCGGVILPLSECVAAVQETMASVAVFMTSFTPIYAAILMTGGRAASALSFQTVALAAAQVMTWLSGRVIAPLLTMSLALGVTGSVTPQIKLGGAGRFLGKTAVWLLTLGMMLFSGLLSLQSLTTRAADNLGTRAIKFSISSFVPVVGSSLSEAFSTVRGCLQLLGSTMGAFGVTATALIVLPTLFQCVGWNILLSVCHMAADMFELQTLKGVLETARSTVRCLIGILAASGLFLIVAVTVVTVSAGG